MFPAPAFTNTKHLKNIQIQPIHYCAIISGILDFLQDGFIASGYLGFHIHSIILNFHMIDPVVGDQKLRPRFLRNLRQIHA